MGGKKIVFTINSLKRLQEKKKKATTTTETAHTARNIQLFYGSKEKQHRFTGESNLNRKLLSIGKRMTRDTMAITIKLSVEC